LSERVEIFGFEVFARPMELLLLELADRLKEGRKTHVLTLNPEMLMLARKDPEFMAVAKEADIITPDGIGIVLAVRFLRGKAIPRLPGIDIAERLLAFCEEQGMGVYLLGARASVVEQACRNLSLRFPKLKIVGYHHGYFQGEEEKVIEDIQRKAPRVLLVGMGAPYQEIFIARTKTRLPCVLMMGVGGSFDVWAMRIKRAGNLVRRMGLEWLYRAFQDRSRWKRLAFIPSFILLVLLAKLRGN